MKKKKLDEDSKNFQKRTLNKSNHESLKLKIKQKRKQNTQIKK